jgi:hypothetical protein
VFVGATSTAIVGKPECTPGKGGFKGSPEKANILHCACSDAGDRLEYIEIQISSKSKGHVKHTAGSIDSCSVGDDIYQDFVRSGSDCLIDGPELSGYPACGDKVALQECGTPVID